MTPRDIKKARHQADLSQTEAAQLMGVSRATWARWESKSDMAPSPQEWAYWLHVAGIKQLPFERKT
jgi:Predicted transcriptional regulator with C-terminal CBS domains